MLVEAAEAGEAQGAYSHGALTPWRLMLTPDGDVQVIGYGVLQPEIGVFHADEEYMPSSRSLRYCPPERLRRDPEDVRSDLFSLSLIVLELLTGEAVYLGNADEALEMAQDGAALEVLEEVGADLPEGLVDALAGALVKSLEERLDPAELIAELDGLVGELDGESLAEFMGRMAGEERLADVDPPEEDDGDGAEAAEGDDGADAEAAPADDAVSDEEIEQAAADAHKAATKTEAEADACRAALEALGDAVRESTDPDVKQLISEIEGLIGEAESAVRDAAEAAEICRDQRDHRRDLRGGGRGGGDLAQPGRHRGGGRGQGQAGQGAGRGGR